MATGRYLHSILSIFLLFILIFKADIAAGQRRNEENTETDSVVEDIQARIYDGDIAPTGRFPYMCSIRRRGSRAFACGGTLIHRQWVMTAAHCVDRNFSDSANTQPIIYCGVYGLNEFNASHSFSTTETVIHEDWDGNLHHGFDIALLRLDRMADFVVPDLVGEDYLPRTGELLAALGWGVSRDSNQLSENLILVENLHFVPAEECNHDHYWRGIVTESMICAGLGQDSCRGDSGGPLFTPDLPNGDVVQGYPAFDLIVGLTSFGTSECEATRPGVYTSLSHFSNWIQAIIDNSVQPETTTDDSEDESAIVSSPVLSVEPEDQAQSMPDEETSDIQAQEPEAAMQSIPAEERDSGVQSMPSQASDDGTQSMPAEAPADLIFSIISELALQSYPSQELEAFASASDAAEDYYQFEDFNGAYDD